MAIPLRTPHEIDAIARVAASLFGVLRGVCARAGAGMTTAELDELARETLLAAGLVPALPGYRQGASPPFPGVACVSVNEQVVHAVPGARALCAGDLLTVDIAASTPADPGERGTAGGPWFADAAMSVVVGEAGAHVRAAALRAAGLAVLEAALSEAGPGVAWRTVADAARAAARSRGVRLIPRYSGHGIGRRLHEQPRVDLGPAPDAAESLLILRPGMVLTIEPIVVEAGGGAGDVRGGVDRDGGVRTLADGWTVVTGDGVWATHEERMIAITRAGARLLTA